MPLLLFLFFVLGHRWNLDLLWPLLVWELSIPSRLIVVGLNLRTCHHLFIILLARQSLHHCYVNFFISGRCLILTFDFHWCVGKTLVEIFASISVCPSFCRAPQPYFVFIHFAIFQHNESQTDVDGHTQLQIMCFYFCGLTGLLSWKSLQHNAYVKK